MRTTTSNLLLTAALLLSTAAMADTGTFLAELRENDVSYMASNAGLLVVFGESDFNEICKTAKSHNANVQMIVSGAQDEKGNFVNVLPCNASEE